MTLGFKSNKQYCTAHKYLRKNIHGTLMTLGFKSNKQYCTAHKYLRKNIHGTLMTLGFKSNKQYCPSHKYLRKNIPHFLHGTLVYLARKCTDITCEFFLLCLHRLVYCLYTSLQGTHSYLASTCDLAWVRNDGWFRNSLSHSGQGIFGTASPSTLTLQPDRCNFKLVPVLNPLWHLSQMYSHSFLCHSL